MKKIKAMSFIKALASALLLAIVFAPSVRADVIEEKDFAIIVPPGFSYKGQNQDYNKFTTQDGKQQLDINTLSELVAGINAPYLFDTLCKQSGYVKNKPLTDRKAGRYCAFGQDGQSLLMVLGDKNGLKISVVIYRWTATQDSAARKNIVDYLIYSHSLDRAFAGPSSVSGTVVAGGTSTGN